MNFYACLPVLSDMPELKGTHITTMFAPMRPARRLYSPERCSSAVIQGFEYWEKPNVTVAIVDCKYAKERFNYWSSLSFYYGLPFIPHITLGEGDIRRDVEHLMGEYVMLGREALNFK